MVYQHFEILTDLIINMKRLSTLSSIFRIIIRNYLRLRLSNEIEVIDNYYVDFLRGS